jgi:hypothetical protein
VVDGIGSRYAHHRLYIRLVLQDLSCLKNIKSVTDTKNPISCADSRQMIDVCKGYIPSRTASARQPPPIACTSLSSQSTHRGLVSRQAQTLEIVSRVQVPYQHPPYWYPFCLYSVVWSRLSCFVLMAGTSSSLNDD